MALCAAHDLTIPVDEVQAEARRHWGCGNCYAVWRIRIAKPAKMARACAISLCAVTPMCCMLGADATAVDGEGEMCSSRGGDDRFVGSNDSLMADGLA